MSKLLTPSLPNIPWQEKPAGTTAPVWRYTENPVIRRHEKPDANSIFNSAVVPFKDGFAGVFRCDSQALSMDLYAGFSKDNRNGVLFPRKIGGMYAMLSRPSDTTHTRFGDVFCSVSPDLTFWGKHRFVMGTYKGDASAWQSTKIGPGPSPIETDEGWLLFYHGVLNTCNGFVYRMGAALLDKDEPWKVKYRSRFYLLAPEELYECVGDVPNVVFPCAALTDGDTGRIAIYYGCADTVTGLCFTTVDETLTS